MAKDNRTFLEMFLWESESPEAEAFRREKPILAAMADVHRELRLIASRLANSDKIDEYPKDDIFDVTEPQRGPQAAIEAVRQLTRGIVRCEDFARQFGDSPLRREVCEVLHRINQHLAYSEDLAELAIYDEDEKQAVEVCRSSVAEAWNRCRDDLERLDARVWTAIDLGLPSNGSGEESRKMTPPEAAAPLPRLTATLDPPQAVVDSRPYALSDDGAALVNVLIEANDWISGPEITKKTGQPRPDRTIKNLPKAIQRLIESKPGKGNRIAREFLA